MEYTDIKWKAVCLGSEGYDIRPDTTGLRAIEVRGHSELMHPVAHLCGSFKQQQANANLMASAVNACKVINPDNPQAVAGSISDTYQALRTIYEAVHAGEIARAIRVASSNGIQALAKAEGKE